MSEITIRPVRPTDGERLAEIYNPYITESIVTFELERVVAAEMWKRAQQAMQKGLWLVAELDGVVVGYAYNHRWRTRAAYDQSTEVAIYVDTNFQGKGVAKALYGELIQQLKSKGFHVLVAGISLPNEASIALHEHFGFKKVAHFEEVGNKFNRWIDVGYWQLTL